MVYVVCGVGQAGGAIVDEMFASPSLRRVASPLAINSTLKDLQSLRNVPRANWLGLSEVRGVVPGNTASFEEIVVGGFGKDPRLATEVVSKNMESIVQFFREFAVQNTNPENLADKQWRIERQDEEWTGVDESIGSVPFAMIVVGLGGGTGCGSAALIAKAIRESSATTTSILAVGVLPAASEALSEGARGKHRQAWNTMYALNELEKHVDGIVLVDNQRLAFSSNVEMMFPDFNRYVAHSLNDLILGNLLEAVDPRRFERLSLPVIDIRDIISAVSFGSGGQGRKPGYASIGWAAEATRRLPGYFLPFLGSRSIEMPPLLRLAIRKQSIHGAWPEEAKKNLGLVRLTPSLATNKRVFGQTTLLEAELGRLSTLSETHFGVTLGKRPLVSVNTLFTYERRQLARLRQMQELASSYSTQGLRGL